MYEEAKKSLKKFKGDSKSNSSSGVFKVEPTFLAENEEALRAAGYVKGKRGKQGGGDRDETWRPWGPRRGESGVQEFPRTEYRRQGTRGGYHPTESGSQISQPSDRNKKKYNPLGPDGRTLTCKSCGSYRHLLPACPDSWENMAKIKIAEEKHAVFLLVIKLEKLND